MLLPIKELIFNIKKQLKDTCNVEHEAEQQAIWLIEEITNKKFSELLCKENINLSEQQQKILNKYIQERVLNNKPLQYIIGHVPFCNLDILVKPPILIPRPETEEMVSWVINKLSSLKNKNINILDLGTGSGCIALALAKNLSTATVIGTDINKYALELAEKNKLHNKIDNATFILSDIYSNIYKVITNKIKFDLIISNPPYITKQEWENLDNCVKNWEDYHALIANDNGFYFHKKIITDAKNYLKTNHEFEQLKIPQLVLEFGKGQEKNIKTLLQQETFKNIQFYADLSGIIRWVSATL